MIDSIDEYSKVIYEKIQIADSCFSIWLMIKEKESWNKNLDVMNDYSSFFFYLLESFFLTAIVYLSHVYETSRRSINFENLFKIAEKKYEMKIGLGTIKVKLQDSRIIASKIKILRDNVYAHSSKGKFRKEAFKEANLTPDEIKELIENSKDILYSFMQVYGLKEQVFNTDFVKEDTWLLLQNLNELYRMRAAELKRSGHF